MYHEKAKWPKILCISDFFSRVAHSQFSSKTQRWIFNKWTDGDFTHTDLSDLCTELLAVSVQPSLILVTSNTLFAHPWLPGLVWTSQWWFMVSFLAPSTNQPMPSICPCRVGITTHTHVHTHMHTHLTHFDPFWLWLLLWCCVFVC